VFGDLLAFPFEPISGSRSRQPYRTSGKLTRTRFPGKLRRPPKEPYVACRHQRDCRGRARAAACTRIVFFITGLGMSAWAPLVPFAKARVGINEGVLGLLLLCLGAGSMVTMPLAGALAARVGCRAVVVGATLLVCLTLPLLASVSSLPLFVVALLVVRRRAWRAGRRHELQADRRRTGGACGR